MCELIAEVQAAEARLTRGAGASSEEGGETTVMLISESRMPFELEVSTTAEWVPALEEEEVEEEESMRIEWSPTAGRARGGRTFMLMTEPSIPESVEEEEGREEESMRIEWSPTTARVLRLMLSVELWIPPPVAPSLLDAST